MAGKILYVCQEIFPYLPESEQSALCRQLVQAMQERGNEIRTFMPRYGCINERRNQLHEVIRLSGMNTCPVVCSTILWEWPFMQSCTT